MNMRINLENVELELSRRACARSFAEFVKQGWHVVEPATDLKWGWALDAICAHLEAVSRGDILRLLMNVPPGTMKSLLTGVFFPAWEWGPRNRPHLRYLGTAHKQDLAVRDNMKCRRLIQSDWYQKRWPIELVGDQNAKTKFENDATGFREAMAFTSMTGSRGDRVLLDDPLSVDDAESDAKLLAAERTFTESLPTRHNNKQSATILIMQRLHERDTSGLILSRKLDFVHLCLPMRFEEDRRCTTSIGFTDPRTKDGELLFEERFDEEEVERLERTLGSYATAGQLQQRPTPRGGGMFKREWFKVVRAAPVGTRFVRGWDLAATDTSTAAYTAGVKIGKQPDGRFIIADVRRDRLTFAGVEKLIVSTATQDGVHCEVSIPQDPGQAGKAQVGYLLSKLAGYSARATPETGSKVVRADPLAAQCEAGNVDIMLGTWNEAFFEEAESFPYSSFLDQVDAASRAFNVLAKGPVGQSLVGTYGTRE